MKLLAIIMMLICSRISFAQTYEFKETRDLVNLVNDASQLVQEKGESSFEELRRTGSKWRQRYRYVFVLDPYGNILVHPDPEMEGHNLLYLKDINGRPIIRGIIDAADGWYHYQWPEVDEIQPRWKTTYVKRVRAPSGKTYLVASGLYNDRMEKSFVVDMVEDAVSLIEKKGRSAFTQFRDKTSRFMAKDTYIFVFDSQGVELVNPAHPNLEGRNLYEAKDPNGKLMVQEMLKLVQMKGSGWVNYMWPKPGESVPTEKSTYVMKAKLGGQWVLVGCGVYLSDAPHATRPVNTMTPDKLMQLVRNAAELLAKEGEEAYPEFRQKGSIWFNDGTYFFIWDMDGNRRLHAADPSLEGKNGSNAKDILGRPYGKTFLNIGKSSSGEGWAHYMYPEPGQIFPAWKSVYLKRVTFPSGEQYLVGSGSYYMKINKTMIEDLVNRASLLVQEKGKAAFNELRDKKGPFYFMDTYVFVDTTDGIEVVNPAYPYIEGRNIANLTDAKGKLLGRDYIQTALKNGSQWIDYHWYRPGDDVPSLKKTFVRKVQSGNETYVIGSGYYVDDE